VRKALRVVFVLVGLGLLALPAFGLLGAGAKPLDSGWDAFLEHALWFRSELLAAHGLAHEALLGVSGEEQVVVGRDGWLFFSETLGDHLGWEGMTQAEIDACADAAARLAAALAARGAGFTLLIAPNKNTVYPEHMPYYWMRGTGPGNAQRLLAALAARGVAAPDLAALLRGEKARGPLYWKTDTHWNAVGALLVYRAVMAQLDAAEHSEYEAASGTEEIVGDLTALYLPGIPRVEQGPAVDVPRIYTTRGLAQPKTALRLETRSARNALSLYFIRDSFGTALFPYFANNAGRLVFTSALPEGTDWADGVDEVIWEIAQRRLPGLEAQILSVLAGLE
jgi:hypothetical protein